MCPKLRVTLAICMLQCAGKVFLCCR